MNPIQLFEYGKSRVAVILPNLFIGGVASTLNTKEALATKIGVSSTNISYFAITGDNIEAILKNTVFGLPSDCFLDDVYITYYKDYSLLCNSIGIRVFKGTSKLKAVEIYGTGTGNISNNSFENAQSLKRVVLKGFNKWYPYNCFSGTPDLQLLYIKDLSFNSSSASVVRTAFGGASNIYIPNLTVIGYDVGNNGEFNESPQGVNIWAHPSLQTSNGGGEEGDIAYARANKAAVIDYSQIEPDFFTAPNPITDLAVGAVYGTAIQLNFTPPVGNTNAIAFYEVYANGIYNNTIKGSGGYAMGLSLDTSYNIEVKTFDIYYNKSSSNMVAQTTNVSEPYPIGNIVSYYKMEGNVLNSIGTNDGTPTAITYGSGLVNNTAIFGSSSKVLIPHNDALSFPNNAPFSIYMLAKYSGTGDGWLLNKRDASNHEYQLYKYQGNLEFLINDQSSGAAIKKSYAFTPTIGQWYHIACTYSGSGLASGIKIYIDNVSVGTTTENASFVSTRNVGAKTSLGVAGWFDGLHFLGALDEVSIFKTALTSGQASEITAKLQSGQSLI